MQAFRCGVAKEWRKFSPHITLGRRNEQSPLPEESVRIIEKDKIELPAWSVKEIIMMKSELTPGGPIYTPLKYFELRGKLDIIITKSKSNNLE